MELDASKETLLSVYEYEDGRDEALRRPSLEHPGSRRLPPSTLHRVLLYFSIAVNVALLGILAFQSTGHADPDLMPSRYAGLLRNVPTKWQPYTPYGVGNKNETDRAIQWESFDISLGEVALDKTWAAGFGLPSSIRFPWDNSKDIYLVAGHHQMHCLRKIHRWVTLAQHNQTQLDGYPHVLHCLDLLRQDIICNADDTPMRATPGPKKDLGVNQTRMCRSWDALNAWAGRNTACFLFSNETQGLGPEADEHTQYRYCPKGSPYLEAINLHFGTRPLDRVNVRGKEIDSMPPYWEHFGERQEFSWDEDNAL